MKSFLWIAALLAVGSSLSAIAIRNFNAARHDRFANDPNFILAGQDLSGIGRSSDGRWATMISPNVFVSSQHFRPGIGQTVTFFLTNDPAGPSFTAEVIAGQQITSDDNGSPDNSDLWVGVIDGRLPEGYAFYPYATADDGTGLVGDFHYMVGRSNTSPERPNLENVAIGTNRFSAYDSGATGNVEAQGVSDQPLLSLNNRPLTATADEALVQTFDSGGPTFTVDGGEITLIGTNWIIFSVDGGLISQESSGFAYLGDHSEAVDAFIAANPPPEPAVVPEPGTFALIGGGAVLHVALRRR